MPSFCYVYAFIMAKTWRHGYDVVFKWKPVDPLDISVNCAFKVAFLRWRSTFRGRLGWQVGSKSSFKWATCQEQLLVKSAWSTVKEIHYNQRIWKGWTAPCRRGQNELSWEFSSWWRWWDGEWKRSGENIRWSNSEAVQHTSVVSVCRRRKPPLSW